MLSFSSAFRTKQKGKVEVLQNIYFHMGAFADILLCGNFHVDLLPHTHAFEKSDEFGKAVDEAVRSEIGWLAMQLQILGHPDLTPISGSATTTSDTLEIRFAYLVESSMKELSDFAESSKNKDQHRYSDGSALRLRRSLRVSDSGFNFNVFGAEENAAKLEKRDVVRRSSFAVFARTEEEEEKEVEKKKTGEKAATACCLVL